MRITTAEPTPLLLNNLSRIAILPAESAELTTEQMNAGQGGRHRAVQVRLVGAGR
ncbi:hypothetical protein [Ponticoccus alexandrii]|uniref:hypothetical protein n=1 Tax=Ponticoccus alexandrii TaxID=1943633 RepID=UPI0003D1BEBB|nr:hypothetical protein [Ponticoccus alexandrii]